MSRAAKTAVVAATKSAATAALSPAGSSATFQPKVPWHRNPHPMFKNLPTTLETFPPTRGCKFKATLLKTALWKYRPVPHLTAMYPHAAGRSSDGRMCIKGRGGGDKHPTLTVNYQYTTPEVPKKLLAFQENYNRSNWLALVYYANGIFAYHPLVDGVKIGDQVFATPDPDSPNLPTIGEWRKLGNVPPGQIVCNVEMAPHMGGTVARAAGACCTVLTNKPFAQEKGLVPLLLPSKEVRLFSKDCWCTVGRMGCVDHKFERLGKAGDSRHRGRKPKVRGTAMNPEGHRHGGGKGGVSSGCGGGLHPSPFSVWGGMFPRHRPTKPKWGSSWALIMRRRRDSKKLSATENLQWEKTAYSRKDKRAARAERRVKAKAAEEIAAQRKAQREKEEGASEQGTEGAGAAGAVVAAGGKQQQQQKGQKGDAKKQEQSKGKKGGQ